nr:lipid A biosynthesis acyltransferase [Caldichromatium japonicum]
MDWRLWGPLAWPSWFVVWCLEALGHLPFPVLWALGQVVGVLGYLIAGKRRRVARRNLERCFPGLDARTRERLLIAHFAWLGVAVLTQGVVWTASRRRLARLVRICGREHLDRCIARGQAVILLVPHFVGLELGGAAFSALVHPGAYMYQRLRNPVFDQRVRRARQRFGSIAIERRDDLRPLIRALKGGRPLFYLPDQDAGRRGVFVPFCGVLASTVPMLGRFAALTQAAVIPTLARFLPWGRGLELIFLHPLADFPSGDVQSDATRMNQAIEATFSEMPAQYFWVHRRFKTRPPGEGQSNRRN